MNLRVAHHGEEHEMDVVPDGPTSQTYTRPVGDGVTNDTAAIQAQVDAAWGPVARMTASLLRAIQRDPNPQGRWKGAIPSTDGTELLIDTADGRQFIATIREVS